MRKLPYSRSKPERGRARCRRRHPKFDPTNCRITCSHQLDDDHSDLLYSAKLTTPAGNFDAYIYLLFEHLSTQRQMLPLRMMIYVGELLDRRRKQHAGPLPIVIPILICHAPGGWTGPVSMQELFEPPPDSIPGLARHVPHFTLLVEDLAHLGNEQLKRRALAAFPKLALWLLRDARDPTKLLADLTDWVDAFRDALRAPHGMQAVIQLLSYLSWVCTREHYQQFRDKIRQQLPQTEQATMMYAEELIQQGRAEGRAEGRVDLLEQLVLQKFGELPPAYRERLASSTDEQLVRYGRRLLTAETLQDMFDE
jgi:hypothetical protein